MARLPILAPGALLLGAVLVGTPEPAAADGGNNGAGLGNPRTVFVTSQVYNANLGGLQGADQKCQALATAAGLKGRYEAWLSDSTASPSTRFTKSKGQYKLVDGTVIANGWADLTDGTLAAPIKLDEFGNDVRSKGYNAVWTATDIDGTLSHWIREGGSGTCNNWSGSNNDVDRTIAGSTYETNQWWTGLYGSFCYSGDDPELVQPGRPLYCFQQ